MSHHWHVKSRVLYKPFIKQKMQHTIIALLQDRPGALSRVTNVFRRRDLNIDTIAAVPTSDYGVSKVVLVIEADNVRPLVAQLEKLIDVFEVRTEVGDGAGDALLPDTRVAALLRQSSFQADGACQL